MNPVPISPTPSIAAVIPLVQARQRAAEVGAKAARLSTLLHDGERVPDGFCVIGTGEAALELAMQAYRPFGANAAVAVRSSAAAEDGSDASFAGQFDTILNVRGEQAFADAMARCWASATGERATAYQGRNGREENTLTHMAVLVQRMIQARVAGVAFSANPLTGAREEVVIEAALGLGDAVVSGDITPDTFVVERDGRVRIQPSHAGDMSLSEAEAQAIASLVRRIEASAGVPQDVEWALDDSGLWLLQARPITALPDAARWESPIPGAKWVKDLQAAEWVTEPLSPLGATTTLEAMAVAREQWHGWPPLPKAYSPGHIHFNGWLYMRIDGPVWTLVANILTAMLSILTGLGMNGHRRARRVWSRRIHVLELLERTDRTTEPETPLYQHMNELLSQLGFWWLEVSLYRSMVRVGEQLLAQLKVPGLAEPAVLFLGNDSLLLEADRVLQQVAHEDSTMQDYLTRFGHFVESADPVHPTLRESPELLGWQIAAAQRTNETPDQRLIVHRAERNQAETAVYALGGLRGYFARRMLVVGQSYAAHTDDAVYHFQRVLAALRSSFLEMGRRLVGEGILQQAEDVFYLERTELASAAEISDLQAVITARRERRERQKRLAPPPFIPPLSDASWMNDPNFKRMPASMRAGMFERGLQQRDGRSVLAGTPGSPGRVRGIARVLASPADFARFQPGDVLVTHATSPIWTPLFGIASAAVTEVGGPFSHAAIVAREYGIPLVDGALDATRLIPDGTPVVVDGSAGIVEF